MRTGTRLAKTALHDCQWGWCPRPAPSSLAGEYQATFAQEFEHPAKPSFGEDKATLTTPQLADLGDHPGLGIVGGMEDNGAIHRHVIAGVEPFKPL